MLSISNIIELCGIVSSLIVSLVAIIISIKTLKQNSLMIEESTRPYISLYTSSLDIGDKSQFHFVFRNTGNSPAIITYLNYNFDLSNCFFKNNKDFLQEIIGTNISNGQSRICSMDFDAVPNQIISFNIEYKTLSGKIYKDVFDINLKAGTGLSRCKNDSTDSIHIIARTLQEDLQHRL